MAIFLTISFLSTVSSSLWLIFLLLLCFVFASIPQLFVCVSHAVLRQIFATLLGTLRALSFSVLNFLSVCFLKPSVSPFQVVLRQKCTFSCCSFPAFFHAAFHHISAAFVEPFHALFHVAPDCSLPINSWSLFPVFPHFVNPVYSKLNLNHYFRLTQL